MDTKFQHKHLYWKLPTEKVKAKRYDRLFKLTMGWESDGISLDDAFEKILKMEKK